MNLPDIRFENIRPLDGNRHAGFEELCCQLARAEAKLAGEEFHRKGPGADAGVECYSRRPIGSEVGWQAKYLFCWNTNLSTQLDDSIRTALNKHPKLVEYVVCLPFDLSDSRIGKRKTAKEKWDDWCAKWKKKAKRDNRQLTITLWDRSGLRDRLIQGNPGYLVYWFDHLAITGNWFEEQFQKSRNALGSRYTPETNVELPIRQDVLAFARHAELQKQIEGWLIKVGDLGSSAVDAIRTVEAGKNETHSDSLEEAINAFTSAFDKIPIEPDQLYPLDNWNSTVSVGLEQAQTALSWVYSLPSSTTRSADEAERRAQRYLYDLTKSLREVRNALASNRWQLANKQTVLLQGPAGIGKSHLLADIVEHHIHAGGPALLFLGSMFLDDEPGRQMQNQLDRPSTELFRHFLGALDAAAQVANMRAIVCIDALNERNGINIWPHRLAAFLTTFKDFPHVGVILSCRSTYVPYVLPEPEHMDDLFSIEHKGFAGDGGEAAKVYLDKRGIVRAGAPNLVPEFDNPLFLKTCCDFLKKQGKNELPKGLRGVTAIFEFYNDAIAQALNRRMKLDPRHEIVPKAIGRFARSLTEAGKGNIAKGEAINLFESVLKSEGNLEKSLLSQLENEGILTIETVRQEDQSVTEIVRFSYERFSDHEIAKRLLDDHLNTDDVASSFQNGQPLCEYVFGPRNYERAGIIEAIAIQLPERTNVEILDTGNETSFVVRKAFTESLLWREQMHFTERTFQLAIELLEADEMNDLLVSISTEPSNRFNARSVHKRLMEMTMPERDACWSIYLAGCDFDGSVKTLISWARINGMGPVDEDRAYLAATMLTWFLTTSHREIRDKATQALACLLSQRLPLAARLLGDFAKVNDLYVLERLLAACYGAALQGTSEPGLDTLAQTTFETIFADGKPPVNALLRDHARGIIEYAVWRGVLDSPIDLTLARPPYQSPWPIEFVPGQLIESYVEDRGHGSFRDQIVRSTAYDAGDFAKYVVQYRVTKWSPARLGSQELPTGLSIYRDWESEFQDGADYEQKQAFELYLEAFERNEELKKTDLEKNSTIQDGIRFVSPSYGPFFKSQDLISAERNFQDKLNSDQWEDFRVRAKRFMGKQLDRRAEFDIYWACRWICKRAHELGWTSERFGNFDNRRDHNYSRTNHKIERVGKKYQWLALHELIARMADNLAYLPNWEESTYQGPHQIGLRDVDPSLLTTQTHYEPWQEWDKTWWLPFSPQLRTTSLDERHAWLESDSDIINDLSLINLYDPKTQRGWIALSNFARWTGQGLHDGSRALQRDTWFRLTCFVVNRRDLTKVIRRLRRKILTAPSTLPENGFSRDFYLGEYAWHPEARDSALQDSDSKLWPKGVPIFATVADHARESGGYDYSVDRTIQFSIPTPWLAEKMKLRLANGQLLTYVDPGGQMIFYDPSTTEPGPGAALVDRGAFLRMLEENDLSAIWVIAGEKNIYHGSYMDPTFYGGLKHTAICYLVGNEFKREFHTEREQGIQNEDD